MIEHTVHKGEDRADIVYVEIITVNSGYLDIRAEIQLLDGSIIPDTWQFEAICSHSFKM